MCNLNNSSYNGLQKVVPKKSQNIFIVTCCDLYMLARQCDYNKHITYT